jgi:hypothetical protein
MDKSMFKYYLDLFLTFMGIVILAVLLFTIPVLLIWNLVISPKFGLPMLTFWETFWILVFFRLIIPKKVVQKKGDE